MDSYEIQHNFGFLVSDLTRLITSEFNDMMAPIELTRSQWRVVVYLHREDGLSQSQLAELLGVGKVTIGGLVDRLEHASWVKRRDDPRDRRTKRVYLTGKGQAVEKEMIERGAELTKRMLRSLSKDERTSLIDMLIAVKDDLQSSAEDRETEGQAPRIVSISKQK
jgi:DNA-binding MarR family transcriptional regulator